MTVKIKKAAAAILAAAMTVGFCSAGAEAADTKTDRLSSAMSKLSNVKLKNKTVKWLSYYDLNPSSKDAEKYASVELFEKKYGGKIDWIPTTWSSSYDDLATCVIGGEGIDIFPSEENNLPKGVACGMFQPVDKYIDLNSSVWKNTKSAMDTYKFGGKHFMFVTSVSAKYFVYYNTATIKKYGLKDPWKLYEDGKWNWNTFKSMLKKFVDEDEERYGLDGWGNQLALLYSAGKPVVGQSKGHLVSNLESKTVEKAMNYQYGLYEDGLVMDNNNFYWIDKPQMMGSGNQLFRIGGYWEIWCDPQEWISEIPPENLGIVPVPSPKGSKSYQAAQLSGYVLCRGAANPEGAARFAECEIVASYDKNLRKLERQRNIDNCGWSPKIADKVDKINELARKYPVVDLAAGCSDKIADITIYGGDVGIRAAFRGVNWSETRETTAYVVEMLVDEIDKNLQKEVKEYK